jgi:uncharacterized protein
MGRSDRLSKWLARLLVAALLLMLPAISKGETAAPARADPALWRIHKDASTVYLFGSMHILPRGYTWSTPEIAAAMSATDRFVFEVPVGDDALKDEKAFIVENGILRGRQSLRGLLSPLEYGTYSAVLRRAGLKPEQFERYRPWLASLMLGLAYLHGPDLLSLKGADDDVMSYAASHGKPINYLESPLQQMELLTIGDDGAQLNALRRLIVTLPQSRIQQQDLLETWLSGDTQRFGSLLAGYFHGSPQAQEILIDSRNRKWMGTIKQLLDAPATSMVTVGAAHIGGEKGLLALLCDEGYEVERVTNGNGTKICAGKLESVSKPAR